MYKLQIFPSVSLVFVYSLLCGTEICIYGMGKFVTLLFHGLCLLLKNNLFLLQSQKDILPYFLQVVLVFFTSRFLIHKNFFFAHSVRKVSDFTFP